MPVIPGAEAFAHFEGGTGVLLCHGFGGDPRTLRPWAQYLADAGLSVLLPRLPGHGTTWQELARTRWEDWYAEADRAFDEMQARCEEIFVMGLSMGGCLALRLAELRGDAIRGVVLVNPSITADTPLVHVLPVLRLVVSSLKSGPADIKNPQDSYRGGYDRVAVKVLSSLPGLWRITRRHLAEVTQPVLAYKSVTDHVVGPASLKLLRSALRPGQLEVRELADSYHVATLDNDAQAVFAGSLDFVRQLSSVARTRQGQPDTAQAS
ncbi:MAG TPA: alpha/beta fold hydrolase [Streptosporangiaceae bacterium]|nr:alpha/beta fold hydrolase [Streptosporangiaceae bacterium]